VDFDAWIERITPADVFVALLAALCAFGYFVLLARAHARAKVLRTLMRECRRRRLGQEALMRRQGFAPRLEYYLRMERDLEDRLQREGIRT